MELLRLTAAPPADDPLPQLWEVIEEIGSVSGAILGNSSATVTIRNDDEAAQNPWLNIADVAAMFKISRQAALKEIGKLVDLDIVRREGQARASYYVLR